MSNIKQHSSRQFVNPAIGLPHCLILHPFTRLSRCQGFIHILTLFAEITVIFVIDAFIPFYNIVVYVASNV